MWFIMQTKASFVPEIISGAAEVNIPCEMRSHCANWKHCTRRCKSVWWREREMKNNNMSWSSIKPCNFPHLTRAVMTCIQLNSVLNSNCKFMQMCVHAWEIRNCEIFNIQLWARELWGGSMSLFGGGKCCINSHEHAFNVNDEEGMGTWGFHLKNIENNWFYSEIIKTR